ncbi:MAG: hypothetical protein IKL65_00390 [Bacilli bacterium]|nr:hypothetical protein [Bacilli bacterium]
MANNQELKEIISNNVSNVISDLIDEEIESHRKKGLPFYEKDIINKMGISKSAFTHYKNGNDGKGKDAKPKMPDLVSLYKIHNYFNVPYSYLLGETKTKDIDNLGVGINLGLNDLSIERLKHLNNEKDKARKEFELYIINCLITNEKFISKFSRVILGKLSRKVANEKYEPIDVHFDENSELFEFEKYKLSSLMNEVIEEISNQNDIPSAIIEELKERPTHIEGMKRRHFDKLLEEYEKNT